MNNPNESILLTEDGHPIGDVVIADNSSYAAHPPPDATVSEVRNTLLKSIASLSCIIAIGVAVVVYAISALLMKTLVKNDILMLPKGEKIAKILEKYKLIV